MVFEETPLTRALLSDDMNTMKELGRFKDQVLVPNYLGFNVIELSRYLGKEEHLPFFETPTTRKIKVQKKEEKSVSELTPVEFKHFFGVEYLSHLRFSDYKSFKKVLKSLPWSIRIGLFESKNQALAEEHAKDPFADAAIRWIDETLQYGLFTNRDLKPNDYVGEYTGVVKPLSRLRPNTNAYCINYPQMFWAWRKYIIDASEHGNESRFINHSFEPNLEMTFFVDRGLMHLVFFANQFIARGTQLTFDYGKDFWRERGEPAKL